MKLDLAKANIIVDAALENARKVQDQTALRRSPR